AAVHDPDCRDGRTGHPLLHRPRYRPGESRSPAVAGAHSTRIAVAYFAVLAAAPHPMDHQHLYGASIYSGGRFASVATTALAPPDHPCSSPAVVTASRLSVYSARSARSRGAD